LRATTTSIASRRRRSFFSLLDLSRLSFSIRARRRFFGSRTFMRFRRPIRSGRDPVMRPLPRHPGRALGRLGEASALA